MLKWLARILLLVFTLIWGVFAVFSGAEKYGWGLIEMLENSPNGIPWVVLLAVNGIAWKWEIIGGVMVIFVGLFLSFFFNMWRPGDFVLIGMIFIPMQVMSVLFITSGILDRKRKIGG